MRQEDDALECFNEIHILLSLWLPISTKRAFSFLSIMWASNRV